MTAPSMLIGAPAFAEQIMRALAIKGDLPSYLNSEFAARFIAEDFTKGEYQWVRRSVLFELGTSQAAVAAQFGIVNFTTRLASQGRAVMAIVDQVAIGNTTAGTQQISYGVNFLGSSIADPTVDAFVRDDRALQARSAYSLSSGTAAPSPLAGTSHKLATIPAGGTYVDPGPWILTNNDNTIFRSGLIFVTTVVNQAINVSIQWREREVIQEELR